MSMKPLVPAAGKGTHMLGLCERTPEPLLPVANLPMIGEVLTSLRRAGIELAAVIVGYTADTVREYVGDGSEFGLKVSYLVQEVPNGTRSAELFVRSGSSGDEIAIVSE